MPKNIKNLILNNFQQWKTGLIKFKPGLNVIVGNTESGKSTLFRAISSILTGKMPEDYIRKNEKDCQVKIEFDNNTYFRRFRSKKENIADANGVIFERVGKDLPFEYFKILGNTKIDFGSKELSLCLYSQFEPHFFITLSDYDKSKLIGTICGIDIVDKLVDSINKDIRANNTNIKFIQSQLEEQKPLKEEKIKEFDSLQIKVDNMLTQYNDITKYFNLLETLLNLKNKKVLLENDISVVNNKLNALKCKINNFDLIKVKELQKLNNLKNILNPLNLEISNIQAKKELLKTTNPIDIKNVNLMYDLYFIKQKLNSVNNDISACTNLKNQQEKDLKNLELKKTELLKDFDKCPLCGGIING